MKKLIPAILFTSAVAIYALKKYLDQIKEDSKSKDSEAKQETYQLDNDVDPKERTKLLGLQADLVLANYLDEKIFLVKHHFVYHDQMLKEQLIKELKADGYIVLSKDDVVTVEKVMLKDNELIKQNIIRLAERVHQDNAIYKGFEILPQ